MGDTRKGTELKRRSIFTTETRPDHPKTSYITSIIHLVKGNVGPGMFAMGEAFKHGGLYVAPFLTMLIALLCVHCQHMLINCAEKMRILYDEEEDADYAETVELCFLNGPEKFQSWSTATRKITNIFICVTQLGFCCVYFVFISENINQILRANGITISIRILMLIVLIPILLFSLITNLKLLMPVSLVANFCMMTSLAITIYFTLETGLPDAADRKRYPDIPGLALYFGTAIFAFEGIALVLPIKNVMKNPNNFNKPFGVLNVGMVLVTAMFVSAGTLGFLKWGEDTAASLTLNAGDSALGQVVKALVSNGVLCGYPLQFFIAIIIMLQGVLEKFRCTKRPLLGELIFRTIMVLVTLAIAQAIPALGLFISLIGAVCGTALALVFPPILEMLLVVTFSHKKWYRCVIITKNIFIMLIALFGFAIGSYMSLAEIIKHIIKGDLV